MCSSSVQHQDGVAKVNPKLLLATEGSCYDVQQSIRFFLDLFNSLSLMAAVDRQLCGYANPSDMVHAVPESKL